MRQSRGTNTLPVTALAALVAAAAGSAVSVRATLVDCDLASVLCVDDTPGQRQEFASIQAAVKAARKGDSVVVFKGDYAGFRVTRSGSAARPIEIVGRRGARVVAPEAGGDTGIVLRRVSHVRISGFEVQAEGMRRGIAAIDATATKPMRGLVIENNTVAGAELANIYASQAAGSRISGNVVSNSVTSHGIYLANAGSDDTALVGNTSHGNAKNGIHLNGDERVGGDGLHTGIVADGNYLYDNAANGFDLDGVQDSTFINNVAVDNGRHGLRAFAIDGAAGPARLVIAHNTFVNNASWGAKLTQDGGGHVVFNNALLSDAGALVIDAPLAASDFNLARRFSLDGESTVVGIDTWRAAGYGANSFDAALAKVFRKPGRGDYRLRAGSPALDRGTPSLAGAPAPDTDFAGLGRPQGKGLDIGAYERARGQAARR